MNEHSRTRRPTTAVGLELAVLLVIALGAPWGCDDGGDGDADADGDADCADAAPGSCDDEDACTVDAVTGFAADCSPTCAHEPLVACTGGDGCCPSGCTFATDTDCVDPSTATVVAVVASSDDGNVAEYAVDEDLASRWSAHGTGEWIELRLSNEAMVDYVQLAAYLGDERISYVHVETSLDGSQWETVLEETATSGTTLELERLDVNPSLATRVRFVGHGNSTDEWNAYTELRVEDFPIDLGGCVDHASSACDGGDVYWFDSCGARQELLDDCGEDETCTAGACAASSTDDLVVVYYNNFEQDTIGTDDYKGAWSYCQTNPDAGIFQDPAGENPTQVFRAVFPEGSVSLNEENGFRCQLDFPEGYVELYLSYRIMFGPGFDPVLGGKLPRIEAGHGGAPGHCPTGEDSFTGGMMFRPDAGAVYPAFYIYHPEQWNAPWYRAQYYDVTGEYPTSCDDFFENEEVFAMLGGVAGTTMPWTRPGYSCAWNLEDCELGATATLTTGEWHTITERVVANTLGEHDGFVEGFVDGVLVAQVTGFQFRTVEELQLNWIDFVGFFGGDGPDWATRKEEIIYYDDIIAFTFTPSSGQPTGHVMRATSDTLPALPYPAESVLLP